MVYYWPVLLFVIIIGHDKLYYFLSIFLPL